MTQKLYDSIHQSKAISNYTEQLLRQHTSITGARPHVLESEGWNIDQIRRDVDKIKKEYQRVELQISEQKRHQIFQDIALRMTIRLTEFQETQNMLLDLIADTQQGKINPLVLPPEELRKQIAIIKTNIPADSTIPSQVNDDNLLQFYTTMKISTRTNNNLLIFSIQIPLYLNTEFRMWRMHKIPSIDTQLGIRSMDTATTHLILSKHRDQYYLLSHEEMTQCQHRQPTHFTCQLNQPRYQVKTNGNPCEIELLIHPNTNVIRIQNANLLGTGNCRHGNPSAEIVGYIVCVNQRCRWT